MPWTSAVRPAASIVITPARPDTSSPGAVVAARGRNRFEVRLASRTVAPGGIARYDSRSRSTPSRCADHPRCSEIAGGTAEVLRIGVVYVVLDVMVGRGPSGCRVVGGPLLPVRPGGFYGRAALTRSRAAC